MSGMMRYFRQHSIKIRGKWAGFHPGRTLLWLFFAALAFLVLYPIIFLISGSLMGNDELANYLGAVFLGKSG